ncbi:YncE family protein [Alcaligenes nematophilus]|uniref:YncE family protein n=1 Tax=Alcaligenes nematophilus TaxID=2994643 RepID=A0ABU3MSQ7_9BURK|nr:YncE family protein [Alcaligenes nematophilus]MDT8464304.1 YncE family protein [Alcaligenes nematophilus]MDT8467975.1 YncE family protein [Alcaligenes nematophilus]MDT8503319.1 YncE family protein [Alcaligenes nematophilus]MDT8523579.1 YncE family protein [Alcaligenes nematophilus]
MFTRRLALSVLSAALLSAGSLAHAQPSESVSLPLTPELAQKTSITAEGALRKDLAYGVYQTVYSPFDKSLYVASAERAPSVRGGVIYKLDPITLDVKGTIYTDESNFGLTTNASGDTLYVTNSLAAAVSKVELKEDGSLERVRFSNTSFDDTKMGPRTIRHDPQQGRVYVGAVGAPAVIWVLDDRNLELIDTIENAGKWVTGLLIDSGSHRLYAANGDGEVMVINTQTNKIEQRWKPAGAKPALLLNFALDSRRNRLYVTETKDQKTVYVLDARNGKLLQELPVGDAMDVLYNADRDELYLTHREQGKVSVLDGGSYAIKAQYNLPDNPNSLELGPDSQLYVTVKAPSTPQYKASKRESVVRIDLKNIKA